MLRLFAILVVLLPALRGVVSVGRDLGDDGCGMSACCEVVRIESCCGLVSTEEVCMMTGGACSCVSSPDELPERAPVPMMPTTIGDLILEIPEGGQPIDVAVAQDHGFGLAKMQTRPTGSSTHNQVQSLLGIWRI